MNRRLFETLNGFLEFLRTECFVPSFPSIPAAATGLIFGLANANYQHQPANPELKLGRLASIFGVLLMKTCDSCRSENAPSSKFCGNCGESFAHGQSRENIHPAIQEPESFEPGADVTIQFIQGKVFAAIVLVLSLAGIIYGIINNTLSSSSVPHAGKTVKPRIPSYDSSPWRSPPAPPRTGKEHVRPGGVQSRFRASEKNRTER